MAGIQKMFSKLYYIIFYLLVVGRDVVRARVYHQTSSNHASVTGFVTNQGQVVSCSVSPFPTYIMGFEWAVNVLIRICYFESPDYQLAAWWPTALCIHFRNVPITLLSSVYSARPWPSKCGGHALLRFLDHSPFQGLAHSVSSAKVFKWVVTGFWNYVSFTHQAV